jgi:hypothetical protein
VPGQRSEFDRAGLCAGDAEEGVLGFRVQIEVVLYRTTARAVVGVGVFRIGAFEEGPLIKLSRQAAVHRPQASDREAGQRLVRSGSAFTFTAAPSFAVRRATDTGLIRLGPGAHNHHAGFALHAVDLLLPCRVGKGADASDFPGDLCARVGLGVVRL